MGATAVTAGPAAVTPAAVRAAEGDRAEDDDTGEEDGVSQDTMAHRAPAPPNDADGLSEELDALDDEDHDDASAESTAPAGDSTDQPALGEERGPIDPSSAPPAPVEDEEPEHDDGDEYDEETGERSPIAPVPLAAAKPPVRPPILPPYTHSRPGVATRQPWYRRLTGQRGVLAGLGVLLVLAIVGFGAARLLGGDGGGSERSAQGPGTSQSTPGDSGAGRRRGGDQATAVDPESVTVAVLNGTTVPGLARTLGDQIEGQGFKIGNVTNSTDQERAESVVLYANGAEREAADVGRRLKISQREAIDAESQALAGDATVVVIAGADKTP